MTSPTDPDLRIDPTVRRWLRLEGLAALVAGIVGFEQLGGGWLWFVPALLIVDVSMVGYLGGPRLGAITYNAVHQWATGLAVLGIGLACGLNVIALAGTILIAHVGFDRALGYGLKLPGGFGLTHLGRIGRDPGPRP